MHVINGYGKNLPILSKLKKWHFLILYLSAAIYACIWVIHSGRYNDFLIFRSSYNHLIHSLPLYIPYPSEYDDLFLYSPAFPIIFSPFALLNVNLGIVIWSITTALLCYWVFSTLPLAQYKIKFFLFFIFFNLLNNFGHVQTNAIMLALMLWFWSLQGEKKNLLRGLLLTVCFLIKGYGAIIGALLIFEKDKFKTILFTILWAIVLNGLVLFFISAETLVNYYKDWFTLITGSDIKENYSVYGILNILSIRNFNEGLLLLLALLLLAIYITCEYFSNSKNTTLFVAFLLIWVTIFNRGAYGSVYIIAMSGVILWHLARIKTKISSIIFYTTIVISSIFPTGFVSFIDKLKQQYYITVFFCLLILIDMLYLKIKELNQQFSIKHQTNDI